MNYSDYRLTFDIHDIRSNIIVKVKRGDNTRRLCISLTEKGKVYQIADRCTAVFKGKKPDGKSLLNDCTIEDNTIYYVMGNNTTNAVGIVESEVSLIGADGKTITSPTFSIQIEDTPVHDDDVIDSTDEAGAFVSLVGRVTNVEERVSDLSDMGEDINSLMQYEQDIENIRNIDDRVGNIEDEVVPDLEKRITHIEDTAPIVDDVLSTESENTVQNRVVTEKFNEMTEWHNGMANIVNEHTEAISKLEQNGGGTGEAGADGEDGEDGATFTPSVSSAGVLSWTNDKGLPNPAPVNIKGADGKDGSDGADGAKGDKGDKGDRGEQGIQGEKGDTGATGANGKDGTNGKDGVSATHSWNGTTLTITSASGTSSANLKGDKGDKGDQGIQGVQGEAGANGAKGDKGDKGDTGSKGDKGDTGATGERGTGILNTTTGIAAYTTAVNGVTPAYRIAISTLKSQAKVDEVLVGDTVRYSYYVYPVITLDDTYAYLGTRVSIRGAAGGAGAAGADGKDAVVTMFIAPNGSDSNDGLTEDTPKKTVKACVDAGATRISAKRGVYAQQVALSNIGDLEITPTDNDLTYAVGTEREPIVFDCSDSIAVSSLATYNSIKRVAYSNSANTQFDKVFTKKSQPPVVSEYGSRYNATIWLLSSDEKTVCIKLKPVLTVAECEAAANTFTYVSGYIYINANLIGVEKIIVPTNWETGFYINGAQRVVLREVEVRFSGTYNIDIRNCSYFDFYKCSCKYTSYASGFHPFNSNGVFNSCYATKNYDGFGVSGYGHTTYVDCVSEFNFDDGVSHHDGTEGTFIGGRYEGNGKGGNTPAYGAKVNIYGGIYKDNASFGIGYLYTSEHNPACGMVQGAVLVGNPVGLSVDANCTVTAMNCTYKGNTTDKKGTFTEYNANYVKSVNGVLPDANGNVVVEGTGGGETGPKNVLPLAINSDETLFVGTDGEKGYKTGYRISSSGTEKASDVNCCTGFIACKAGDVIRLKNVTTEASGYSQAYFFTSAFAKATGTISLGGSTPDANGVYSFTVPSYSDIAYTRITVATITADTIITVNEEITE